MSTEINTQDISAKLLQVISVLVAEMHSGQSLHVHINSYLERDLGLDSLARAELLLRIGHEFGVHLPEAALAEAETPRDLLRFITQTSSTLEPIGKVVSRLQQEDFNGIPEQAETLIDVLEWHAEHNPSRTHALLYGEDEQAQPISYAELQHAARRIAAGLVTRGLVPRQTVVLMLPTGRSYLSSFLGVLMAGGIPVPIYPPMRMTLVEEHLKRHARILNNAQAILMITVSQAKSIAIMLGSEVPSLAGVITPEELDHEPITLHYRSVPSDIAFLQYTSGSTGDPKGVVLTHSNVLANLRAMGKATGASSEDVFVSWLPLYHDMGLIGAWLGSLYLGMPLVLMSPLAFLSRPIYWLMAISRHRGTISAAPNFAYELCVRKIDAAELTSLDLSSWRLALNGAEPVSPMTLDTFAERFSSCGLKREALMPVYGLAECSVGLAFPPLGRGPLIDTIQRELFTTDKYAAPATASDKSPMCVPSCGRPLPQHEIRIVDEAGEEVPDRWVGRLQFRGPSATAGYFYNPDATRNLFRDGWLDSGDYAYSVNGEIFLTGREKDLIIRGGRNIYPYELEQAVGDIPGVRKGCVAAFASTDPINATERLVIVAETREKEANVRENLRQKINGVTLDIIGMPADEIILAAPNTVLKTSSGKIRRAASREAYEKGMLDSQAVPPWQLRLRLGSALLRAYLAQGWHRTTRAVFASWCWLAFLSIGLPTTLLVALLQRPAIGRYLAHGAARLFLALIGMTVRISGLNKVLETPHILLVNHSSYLDALALYATLPFYSSHTFVAKRELTRQPLFHTILRGLGTLFVERIAAVQSIEDVENIVESIKTGNNLIIFPEGTFSREAGLKPFHMGAFIAAARSGAPVLVAGLRGTRTALRDESWMPHFVRLELEFGPLLKADEDSWIAATHLRDTARTEMLKLCGEYDLTRQTE